MLFEKPTEGNLTVIAVKDTTVNDAADHVNDDHVIVEEPSISTFFGNVKDKSSFYDLGNFTNNIPNADYVHCATTNLNLVINDAELAFVWTTDFFRSVARFV
ncbi:hypothetical protein TNCV_5131291 [Trichonephila clavipes]|nr:hypothetical protein TNCV_5131291 [Trichonephila clavipes]